jgi:hypothetical protein
MLQLMGEALLWGIFLGVLPAGLTLVVRERWQFHRQVPELRAKGWEYESHDSGLRECFGRAYPFVWPHQAFTRVLRERVHGMAALVFKFAFYNQSRATRTVVVIRHRQPLPRVMAATKCSDAVRRGWRLFASGGADTRPVHVPLTGADGRAREEHLLSAEDQELAQSVYTARVRDLTHEKPRISWRLDGHAMVAWTETTLGPRDALAVAERCVAILREVPSHVWARGALETDPWPGPCPERPA